MTGRQITLDQPRRIQRRRLKGWRAPAGAVYVGRGTRWGNPYLVRQCGPTFGVVDSRTSGVIFGGRSEVEARRVAVDWYRAWAAGQADLSAAVRQQLAGRDLMCWCPLPEPGDPDHCHGAVLLALANETSAR
ncbi:DUF4326 domain-containing protein [Streptomyces broussonetiae]|uniref:DUF4326 domain-containing protein n=1 Tax=Streptomyces broussonetiae TaxID=2686304 RepID=A0ABV5E5L2_9ACTN